MTVAIALLAFAVLCFLGCRALDIYNAYCAKRNARKLRALLADLEAFTIELQDTMDRLDRVSFVPGKLHADGMRRFQPPYPLTRNNSEVL